MRSCPRIKSHNLTEPCNEVSRTPQCPPLSIKQNKCMTLRDIRLVWQTAVFMLTGREDLSYTYTSYFPPENTPAMAEQCRTILQWTN